MIWGPSLTPINNLSAVENVEGVNYLWYKKIFKDLAADL
jgi:hypothetical protein